MKGRTTLTVFLVLALVLGLAVAAQAQTSVNLYQFVKKWGTQGTGSSQFNHPSGIAMESTTVYVVDTNNHRVQVFTVDANYTVTYVTSFGSYGLGDGQFQNPTGIALYSYKQGNTTYNYIYVADTGNNRVQKWQKSGTTFSYVSTLSGANLSGPTGLAVDDSGNVLVADTGNHCIKKFDSTGKYQATYGSPGSGNGQFQSPQGLAFLKTGNNRYLFVADTGNHRIQKLDATNGSYDSQWSSAGSEGSLNAPVGVAVESAGSDIYVSDTGNHRVLKFSNAGGFLARCGMPGSGDGQFDQPKGLTATANEIFACDAGNHRVQIFKRLPATANAGPDQTVNEGALVTLNGGNSSPAAEIVAYQWTQVSGPQSITLTIDPSKPYQATFTAPEVGPAGESYTFRLTVTFKSGTISDDCIVNVQNVNKAPVANAGPDQEVPEGSTVTLDGSASSDPDGDPLTYSWQQVGTPTVTLTPDPGNPAKATFTAPDVGPSGTSLTFQLTVSDGSLSGTDTCVINVTWVNQAPTAVISSGDQTVNEGDTVQLDGSGSSDPDNAPSPLTYQWSVVSGPPVTFSDPQSAKPTFTAPQVGPEGATLVIKLTVSDGALTSEAQCTITVQNVNTAPVAEAGDDVFIYSSQRKTTVIQGSATDADGDALTYRWVDGGTVGEDGKVQGGKELCSGTVTDGKAPLDLADISLSLGKHTLHLEVSDGLAWHTDTMTLNIANSAPTVTASGGGTYKMSELAANPVILGGTVSDYDGDNVTYQWKEGDTELFSGGPIATEYGGEPVNLPLHDASGLHYGSHNLTLMVSDGVNDPVTQNIVVVIVDDVKPTLQPTLNKSILWPPNKAMVDIVIQANAKDNSGDPVSLDVQVACNESVVEGVDYTTPQVNGDTITLKLCADRSGKSKGTGRIYSITITATDMAGNSSMSTVQVKVPHDQRYQER